MRKEVRYLCHGAIIAALYAVLTLATWSFSSMSIQVRISEAFAVLPLFTPAAVPGLFVGCLIANLLGGGIVIDTVFGSLATLVAACLTYLIGKRIRGKARWILAPLPAVLLNAIVVPFVLYYGYGFTDFMGYDGLVPVLLLNALSVGIGEIISCYGLGIPLYHALDKLDRRYSLFVHADKKTLKGR